MVEMRMHVVSRSGHNLSNIPPGETGYERFSTPIIRLFGKPVEKHPSRMGHLLAVRLQFLDTGILAQFRFSGRPPGAVVFYA